MEEGLGDLSFFPQVVIWQARAWGAHLVLGSQVDLCQSFMLLLLVEGENKVVISLDGRANLYVPHFLCLIGPSLRCLLGV